MGSTEGLPTTDAPATVISSRSDLKERAPTLLFAVAVAAVAIWWLIATRHWILQFEDFRLIDRGMTFRGMVMPYNDHLSIVPLIVYQFIARAIGTDVTMPYAVVGAAAYLAVSVSLFVMVKRRVGSSLALVAGVAMLCYPHAVLLVASFNHFLAFVGIVVCAWLLAEHPERHHLGLAAALSFALCSSGVSVAGAAGCGMFLVLTRPSWRRWTAVIVPMSGWIVWRHLESKNLLEREGFPGTTSFLHQIFRGLWSSFDGLTFNNHVLGALLGLVFMVHLAWRLRKGPRRAAHEISWTFAAVAWWAGLSISRAQWGLWGVFRYQYIGSAFLILATLPTEKRLSIGWFKERARPRAVFRVAAFGMALVIVAVNLGSMRHELRLSDQVSAKNERMVMVATISPTLLPDIQRFAWYYVIVPPVAYRSMFARFGTPPAVKTSDPDRWLLEHEGLVVSQVPADPTARCEPSPPIRHVKAGVSTVVAAGTAPVTIEARLVGAHWQPIMTLESHHAVEIQFDTPLITSPWQLRAEGACAPR